MKYHDVWGPSNVWKTIPRSRKFLCFYGVSQDLITSLNSARRKVMRSPDDPATCQLINNMRAIVMFSVSCAMPITQLSPRVPHHSTASCSWYLTNSDIPKLNRWSRTFQEDNRIERENAEHIITRPPYSKGTFSGNQSTNYCLCKIWNSQPPQKKNIHKHFWHLINSYSPMLISMVVQSL